MPATGRRGGQVEEEVEGEVDGCSPSRTTSWTWSNENRHEGHRICVGNRPSRWPGRRRGRRRDRRLQHRPEPLTKHGPTRTGTKNVESASATGRLGGQVEDEVDGCSSSRTTSWTWPDKNRHPRHEGPRNVVENRSETGRPETYL